MNFWILHRLMVKKKIIKQDDNLLHVISVMNKNLTLEKILKIDANPLEYVVEPITDFIDEALHYIKKQQDSKSELKMIFAQLVRKKIMSFLWGFIKWVVKTVIKIIVKLVRAIAKFIWRVFKLLLRLLQLIFSNPYTAVIFVLAVGFLGVKVYLHKKKREEYENDLSMPESPSFNLFDDSEDFTEEVPTNVSEEVKIDSVFYSSSELTYSSTAASYNISNKFDTKEQAQNYQALVTKVVDPIIQVYGEKVKISSGFRNEEVNRLAGGSDTSQHKKGQAIDLLTGSKKKNDALFKVIVSLCRQGKITPDKVIWETDGMNYWIHISFVRPGYGTNRGEFLYTNDNGKHYRHVVFTEEKHEGIYLNRNTVYFTKPD